MKPGSEPAAHLNDMAPTADEAPAASPDFGARQLYLDAAPGGVEARWAWTQAGGRGAGIRIIDIEGAWRFTHEDLKGNQGGVVGGTMSANIDWRNHGTAVLGEYSGDNNSFGVQGIASDAIASAISIFGGTGSAGAINAAAARLGAGDVILIELHRPGPRHGFATRDDQRGYIAVEWWPDDFAAIRNAVNRGIIVGRGGRQRRREPRRCDLPDARPGLSRGMDQPVPPQQPRFGRDRRRARRAAAGHARRSHGADRSRLDFSNWGALVEHPGLGPRGHDLRLRRPAGRRRRGPVVHRYLLGHVERVADRRRRRRLAAGDGAGARRRRAHSGAVPQLPAHHRLRAAGRAGSPRHPADRHPAEPPPALGLRLRQEQGAQGDHQGSPQGAGQGDRQGTPEGEGVRQGDQGQPQGDQGREGVQGREGAQGVAKEIKERPEKQIKEKDKEKDVFEGGGIRDRIIDPALGGGAPGAGDIEGRLASIESAVEQLVHFIGAALASRPLGIRARPGRPAGQDPQGPEGQRILLIHVSGPRAMRAVPMR
ncbi:MAG: hypothetical protein WDN24_11570 [Sphingomonas sp.]